jgi:hypothetical protein
MRYLFVFIFLLFLGNIQAQTANGIFNITPHNIVKTNPSAIIVGPIVFASEYRIALENTTTRNQSLQFGVSFLSQNSILKSQYESDSLYIVNNISLILRGYRIQFSYRFYLKDDAPKGLYLAPHLSYSFAKVFQKQKNYVNKDAYFKFVYSNFAGILGYQIIANRTVAIDIFGGVGLKYNTFDLFQNNKYEAQNKEDLYLFGETFKMYLGFNVGYAF